MDSSKKISLSIICSALLISGVIFFSGNTGPKADPAIPKENNVYVSNNKQVVELTAKGGFEPVKSIARADMPTTLRITTDATFDCSSVMSIPELGIRKNLPSSGVTEIEIGAHKAGTLQGTCGMGMYPFTIEFK